MESLPNEAVICLHHKKVFLDLYSSLQKKCCNPYEVHEDASRKGLRTVALNQANEINKTIGHQTVKAGMKLCTVCHTKKRVPCDPQEEENLTETELMDTDSEEYIPNVERE